MSQSFVWLLCLLVSPPVSAYLAYRLALSLGTKRLKLWCSSAPTESPPLSASSQPSERPRKNRRPTRLKVELP